MPEEADSQLFPHLSWTVGHQALKSKGVTARERKSAKAQHPTHLLLSEPPPHEEYLMTNNVLRP